MSKALSQHTDTVGRTHYAVRNLGARLTPEEAAHLQARARRDHIETENPNHG